MDSKNSFEIHTWMIARLIETSGSNIVPLSHYVIATCYERMITRMMYRVSKSFRDTLKCLPSTFELPKQFPPMPSNSNDSRFIAFLLKVISRLKLYTPIDKLVKHQNDLYNEETYVDFHSILCELLELLLKSLDDLKVMHHKFGGKLLSLKQLDDTIAKVDFIAMVGTLLRLLVKSRAIKKCLHSVARFLPDRASGLKAEADDKTEDDDDDDDDDELPDADDEVDDEVDGELVGQDSGTIKIQFEPKSQACMRSLNLTVAYFDALLVLSHFVKIQNLNSVDVNIDIKILLLPALGSETRMLPWETLLQHETYFPGKPSPSAKEIIEFLKPLESIKNTTGEQQSSNKGQKLSKKSQKSSDNQKASDNQKSSKKSQKSSKKDNMLPEVCPESIANELSSLQRDLNDSNIDAFTDKITQTINSLKTLHYGDATPGSTQYINSIIKKLDSIKNTLVIDRSTLDIYEEINDIVAMLRTLGDNARLERKLRTGSPLDTGVGFKGRLHAEACLTSHCTFVDPEWSPFVSHFIMFCSDLPDVVCSLYICEEQVYRNFAVQSVDLCSGTSTSHSFSQTHTIPSKHVHCLPLFRWRLLRPQLHSLGVC
jgi:hypothetical protein